MLVRKTVVLAKVEATYGTDPVPTPEANALQVYDVDLKAAGDAIQRNFIQSSLSQSQFIRGIRSVEISFKTELKGTGTRGALPTVGWEGTLFRACGMKETVTEGTSIVYSPISTDFESVTLYVYRDGIFHKIVGCMGTFKITGEVGKYLEIEWKFNGIYASPTDASASDEAWSQVKPVTIVGASFSIGAYAAICEKLEIDINNTIAARKSLNAASGLIGFQLTGRSPQGSFDPEVVTEATHGFWAKWESADALALSIGPIGSTSGNIIAIAAPKVQYKDLSYGDRDGVLTYQVPFALAMNAGDDELTITIT